VQNRPVIVQSVIVQCNNFSAPVPDLLKDIDFVGGGRNFALYLFYLNRVAENARPENARRSSLIDGYLESPFPTACLL